MPIGMDRWPSEDVTLVLSAVRNGHRPSETPPIEVFKPGRQIRPKSPGQARFIDAIRQNDIVFCYGPAGTGKTYLAVAMAVAALKKETIRKIVLVRPAVEAGESLGFLPGDLQAKINPYLRPLMDALHEMMDHDLIKRYTEEDLIEVIPLAYMRGRTLNEAFIILDEAQNTTVSQMKMFLTRMGTGSKIVVSGDVTQIDLPPQTRSGLVDALARLRGIEGIAAVTLSVGGHRPPSAGAADRRRLRRTFRRSVADERTFTMPFGNPIRTRSERVAALELPPGQWERVWATFCRRDSLARIGLVFLAAVAMCVVIEGWDPPFAYRTGYTPSRNIVARVPFTNPNPEATELAQQRARSQVRYVYAQDAEPLVQLRARLRNTIVELTAAATLKDVDPQIWKEFQLPAPAGEAAKRGKNARRAVPGISRRVRGHGKNRTTRTGVWRSSSGPTNSAA